MQPPREATRIIFGYPALPVRNPIRMPPPRPVARASFRVRVGRWLLAALAVAGYMTFLAVLIWAVARVFMWAIQLGS